MVVGSPETNKVTHRPFDFVLHSTATLGMVWLNESLITFEFVRVSVSASNLTHLTVRALIAFKPALRIDVQSLPYGLRC